MIDAATIFAKFPAPVPRYTSYPTAPHFSAGMGKIAFAAMADGLGADEPISVYIHIPFCDRLCWFCGCHTRHTLKYAPIAAYVGDLIAEIALVGERFGRRPKLGALHFGGGSPSLLQSADALALMAAIDRVFDVQPDAAISIEIDPGDAQEGLFATLSALRVTRASIGVQDFDPVVQAAINRPQGFEITRDVVVRLREAGIRSVNIDALYGLPHQTEARLVRTLEQCVSLQPDRMAMFGYAHVPWLKKHQKLIDESALPGTMERYHQAMLASDLLVASGYEAIGIDHFALPGDSLAHAARTGSLRRNFQGYTDDAHTSLIGLGASSIGGFDGGYFQNIVATSSYRQAVAEGNLPQDRGLLCSDDDKVRAFLIERLMCDFTISHDAVARKFGGLAEPYIHELEALGRNGLDGLCSNADGALVIPEAARTFVRIVASHLDAWLQAGQHRYSKAV